MTTPKLEELRKIPFRDQYDAFNALSEDDLEKLHAEGAGKVITKMDVQNDN